MHTRINLNALIIINMQQFNIFRIVKLNCNIVTLKVNGERVWICFSRDRMCILNYANIIHHNKILEKFIHMKRAALSMRQRGIRIERGRE